MSDAPAETDVETTQTKQGPVPVVTITRGNPTAEETAVLTVLLAAMSGGSGEDSTGTRRGWSRPARRLSRGLSGMGWGRF